MNYLENQAEWIGRKSIIESAPKCNDVTYYVTSGIPSRGNSQQGIPAGEKLAMSNSKQEIMQMPASNRMFPRK